MMSALECAAAVRIDLINNTDECKRSAFAQHLTPPETAELAVSMFSDGHDGSLRCLDLGAGSGILSVAVYERYGELIDYIDVVESDPVLASVCQDELRRLNVTFNLVVGDALRATPAKQYDRVILNPPYKKMSAGDPRQQFMPFRSANLYAAFVAIGLTRLSPGGELIAIIPRSWMNGGYFTSFRRFILEGYSIDSFHIYESRTNVFAETDVLQETMIVRISNNRQRETVHVGSSNGRADQVTWKSYPAKDLIDSNSLVIRVAPECNGSVQSTISAEGLCPSTGKVVDFRSRERIYYDRPNEEGIYPLVYAGNFAGGAIEHPLDFGKPQWFRADTQTTINQLTREGFYVVVKRFSSKEERRRVVAYPLHVQSPIGIENHLNFIHAGKPRKVVPLSSMELAQGLALWLNSTFIDKWFRDVSGSTQVNAGDIKAMPCPSLSDLERIGVYWRADLTQEMIDAICEELK